MGLLCYKKTQHRLHEKVRVLSEEGTAAGDHGEFWLLRYIDLAVL